MAELSGVEMETYLNGRHIANLVTLKLSENSLTHHLLMAINDIS